jgi:hypothetical protein
MRGGTFRLAAARRQPGLVLTIGAVQGRTAVTASPAERHREPNGIAEG